MLKKILSPAFCAECRLCCKFDCTDTWELPVFAKKTADAVTVLSPDAQFTQAGDELTFKAPPLSGGELYSCPALTDHGCGLSAEHKPFDCMIWPFRMMRDENGRMVITVCTLCNGIGKKDTESLAAFLREEKLDTLIFSYAEKHPSHIKPLMDGYRIVLSQQD